MFFNTTFSHLPFRSPKATITFLLLCLLSLCIVLCFGNPLRSGNKNLIADSITYFTNTMFCENSSTMEYLRQTTYSSFSDNTIPMASKPSLYTYLQYHSKDKGTMKAVVMEPVTEPNNTPESDFSKATEETSDTKNELTAGIDISDGQDPYDDVFFEDLEGEDSQMVFAENTLSANAKDVLKENKKIISTITSTFDLDYMLKKLYHINPETGIDKKVFDVKKLLTTDVSIKKNSKEPQILIFHTHAHEWFADSRKGVKSDTVVGVGDELARILTEEYGYNVIHYSKQYDYNYAYNQALADLQAILKKYPSIKVVLDVHRDGVSEKTKTHTTVKINNETMAKLMFFNGVCYTKNGPLKGYTNPNLKMNLAFSLQMRLYAMETFPQLTKYNFLKSYRYNMHLMPRYSLVEVGDNNNTVAEAKAAMKPLAAILNHVLTEENPYAQ